MVHLSVYWSRQTLINAAPAVRPARGPVGGYSDVELVSQIRLVLAATASSGEGTARCGRSCVTAASHEPCPCAALVREHNLRAPSHSGKPRGPRNHDGTIIPDAPDLRWGTDLTGTWTVQDGGVSVMLTINHHTADPWASTRPSA